MFNFKLLLFGNIFTEIEEFFQKLIHPEAKQGLADASAWLTANKAALVTEFGTAGQDAASFLTTKLFSYASAVPAVAPFVNYLQPIAITFLGKEIGYGTTDIGELIDKLAAWLIAEEANV